MPDTENEYVRSNLGYMDAGYLQLKLDTQKLHTDIYHFLTGTIVVADLDAKEQRYVEKEIPIGSPLANKEGIQNLLNFVVSIVNNHTMQGNTERDELMKILKFMHLHLAEMLMSNCSKWGIDKPNRRHILRTIMSMSYFALSRTIDNEERKSHTPTIERYQSVRETEKKKILGVI